MSFHSTSKPPKNSTSLGQSKQNRLIPFPAAAVVDEPPSTKSAKTLDLYGTLYAANPDIDDRDVYSRIYKSILCYTRDELYEVLCIPSTAPTPFNYLPNLARGYVMIASEMICIEVERLDRPMSMDEIYDVIDKCSGIAGNQARMAEMIMRVDLVTGESLERR